MLAALGLFVLLGHDGRHHWHEWRYLYSAANYSIETLIGGGFDPGPPPERSPAEVGAWYWGQALHEVLLAQVLRLVGGGLFGIRVLQWLSAFMVVLGWGCWYRALRSTPIGSRAGWLVAIGLVSPLSVWLGFKLMAEAPAFLLASFSALSFMLARERVASVASWGWYATSGASLALSFLAMVYMPLVTLGFFFALRVAEPSQGKRLWMPLLVVSTSAVSSLLICLVWLGMRPADYLDMYGFYRAYEKSWIVNLFGVLTAGSVLWALVPFAIANRDSAALRMLNVWALAALLPILVLSSNYLESRFVMVIAPCLAGIAVLAFEVLLKRQPTAVSRIATIVGVGIVSAGTLPFLPYEMSSREISRVVERHLVDQGDVLLVPWNYTDFHYLRLRYPRRQILLVQSPVDSQGNIVRNSAWRKRMEKTYGDAYVGGIEALEPYADRDLFYVGHGRMPPFENLARFARFLGLDAISALIDAMNPLEPITHSWMWRSRNVVMEPLEVGSQYRLYAVRLQ